MTSKWERIKTVRGIIRNLKKRTVHAEQELKALSKAIDFYGIMLEQIMREKLKGKS